MLQARYGITCPFDVLRRNRMSCFPQTPFGDSMHSICCRSVPRGYLMSYPFIIHSSLVHTFYAWLWRSRRFGLVERRTFRVDL